MEYANVSLNDEERDRSLLFRKKPSVSDFEVLKTCARDYCTRSVDELQTKRFYKSLVFKRLPFLKWLFVQYSFKRNFVHDLIAGLTVGIMNMPQSLGYALLANLPAVHGLYMSFFPILVYFLFGTSKHLSIGAIAIVSLFSGDIIQSMSDDYRKTLVNVTANNTDALVMDYKVQVASALALFVGLLQMLIGLTGLGIVTDYFSDAFVSGYTSSSAVHVLVSQLKDLLGLKNVKKYNGALKIPKTIVDIFSKIGSTNMATLVVTIICLFYLIVFKELINPRIKRRLKFEFPSELFLVIGVTLASYYGHLNERYGIDIVKTIPQGLPSPIVPEISLWKGFISNGVLATLIATSISISLAKLYSNKNNYAIDTTQEFYAYGSSNIFASFFGCYPVSGSLTRTTMLHVSGGQSQVDSVADSNIAIILLYFLKIASLFSASIILIVILFMGTLFQPLAIACLASVIVVALKSLLFQIKDFFYLWRVNKYEALTWLGTYLSVVLLDVDIGLFIGLALTILLIVVKDQRIGIKNLVKYKGLPIYLDKEFIQNGEDLDAINAKVLKIERSLYFVNIEAFKNHIHSLYANLDKNSNESTQSILSETSSLRYLLLDFAAVNYVDTTAVKSILDLIKAFKKDDKNVCIFICQCQDSFIQIVNKMDLMQQFEQNLFITVEDAVGHIQATG